MPDHLLAIPRGYDPNSQAVVGVMAASLDDQSRRLRETVAGLEVEHLEWQEHPGRNTIGMLMAHLAGTEVGWFQVGCAGLSYEDDGRRVLEEHLGMSDFGMPLAADGVHPDSLRGRVLEDYFDLLARARSATHGLLEGWDDASLDKIFGARGMNFSRRWVIYHILEHVAAHFGQIGSLLHCMRDREVPGLPEKRGLL